MAIDFDPNFLWKKGQWVCSNMVSGMTKKEESFEDFQKLPEEISISFSMINIPVYTNFLHHLLDPSCFYYPVGKSQGFG